MSLQLDARPEPAPYDPFVLEHAATDQIVIYGDFSCPWSYLAARRAAVLAAAGVSVDFRAVQHDPRGARRLADRSTRFACLRTEMDHVVAQLLPGEELPYALAGFVPHTEAAVSGYGEAYAAGAGARVRDLLFEAFWMHALDLGDAHVVRTLLVDAVRSGSSPRGVIHEWGYAVDVTGGPVTTRAWRLVSGWAAEWRATGTEVVPVVIVGASAPLFGVDAVERLGAELLRRGLESCRPPTVPERAPGPYRDGDLASLSWVSQLGSRWMRDYQLAHRQPLFPSAS